MAFDVVSGCPNLVKLVGADELRAMLDADERWPHPLKAMCSREGDARDQYLAALDRAAELIDRVLARSVARLRNKMAANIRDRSSYQATVSELICGARLEALGAEPVMEGDGAGPQPDYLCRLFDEPFYTEVYTPGAAPDDSLLDDIGFHLADYNEGCFVSLDVSRLERRSEYAKLIAGRVKVLIRRMQNSGTREAIMYVRHGKSLEDCVTELGRTEISYPVGEDPEFFGRFHMDGIPHLRLTGIVDGDVVDDVRDARAELRRLRQLRKGARNLLVVDLTCKHVHPFMIKAYEQVCAEVFERHPELSAVLVTWRYFGLQPAPSIQQEMRSGYVLVPAPNPTLPMSPSVLDALKTRWLILRGRTEPAT